MPPISFHYLYIDSHINAHIHFLQYSLAFHTSSDLSRMYPMSIILPSSGVYKPHPTDHMFSLPIPKSTYRYTYLVATNINAAAYPNPTPCAPRHTPARPSRAAQNPNTARRDDDRHCDYCDCWKWIPGCIAVVFARYPSTLCLRPSFRSPDRVACEPASA